MAIGIYYGKGKPGNIQLFLEPFVQELQPILENGIILEGVQYIRVKIRSFICDSPALLKVRNT